MGHAVVFTEQTEQPVHFGGRAATDTTMEKYVRFYCNQLELMQYLPDDVVADLLRASLAYKDDGTKPTRTDDKFQQAWLTMKSRLDGEHETYLRKSEACRTSARRRSSSWSTSCGVRTAAV